MAAAPPAAAAAASGVAMVTGDRDMDEGPGKDLAPEELAALLLPHAAEHAEDAGLPMPCLGTGAFALAVDAPALAGWTAQPGPVCAAASAASAFNAVLSTRRDSENAATTAEALSAIVANRAEKLRGARASLRRLLAISAPDDGNGDEPTMAEAEAWRRCLAAGRRPGRKLKDNGIGAAGLVGFARAAAAEAVQPVVEQPHGAWSEDADELARLGLLWQELAPSTDDADGENADGENCDGEGENVQLVVIGAGKRPKKPPPPPWLAALKAIFTERCALARLEGDGHGPPSTAPVGNGGIRVVVSALAAAREGGPQPRARCLLARRTNTLGAAEMCVRSDDCPDEVTRQWDLIFHHIARTGSCVQLHLRNHYALAYAARSYVTADSVVVREILTARKGQQPRTWLPFDELRTLCLSWDGHCAMVLEV